MRVPIIFNRDITFETKLKNQKLLNKCIQMLQSLKNLTVAVWPNDCTLIISLSTQFLYEYKMH